MTSLQAYRQRLFAWMRAWVDSSDEAPPSFDELALTLHDHQRGAIDAYDRYCRSRGGHARRWDRVPCVPVGAFKVASLSNQQATDHPVAMFETSGTSDGQPGRVRLASVEAYERSLLASFHHFMVPEFPAHTLGDLPQRSFQVLSLVPGDQMRPHSSLGHMVRVVASGWGDGAPTQLLRPAERSGEAELALEPFDALDERPVLLLATTLALDLLRAKWPKGSRVRLPRGSRLMDTGGPKGRSLSVSREDQHAWLQEHLGLADHHIVGELGMTELASQRYETVLRSHVLGAEIAERRYVGPPWLRTVALDPQTLTPTAGLGLLAHVDLANIDTCAFVMTADLGLVDEDTGAVTLQERLPKAEWRGCGLDVEQLFERW